MKSKSLWWLLCFCTACSLPLKSNAPAEQTYRLQPEIPVATSALPVNLVVPKLVVSPELDNAHITLIKPPNQLDYIAHSRWPDTLAVYLQAVVLDALARSGQFQSVSEQVLGSDRHYRLLLRVVSFQAEYPFAGQTAAAVEVKLEASLIRLQDQHLLLQQRYTSRQEHIPVSTSQIVMALDQALAQVLQQVLTGIRPYLAS